MQSLTIYLPNEEGTKYPTIMGLISLQDMLELKAAHQVCEIIDTLNDKIEEYCTESIDDPRRPKYSHYNAKACQYVQIKVGDYFVKVTITAAAAP